MTIDMPAIDTLADILATGDGTTLLGDLVITTRTTDGYRLATVTHATVTTGRRPWILTEDGYGPEDAAFLHADIYDALSRGPE